VNAQSNSTLKEHEVTSIGVVLPQTELGGDVTDLRRYADAVEHLGYTLVMAYDHVVGADRAVYPDLPDYAYDVDTTFHEPLVTFGYLAARTNLELFTGIVILPQRQTALVAKQAAQVDLLSAGRLRLGVGLGWNRVEYEALGQDFAVRAARFEEQIALLRQLWTQRSVTARGRFDTIIGAGLAPLPVQRPIPVWIGGRVPAAYRRAGRLADGWFPEMAPGPELDAAIALVAEGATEAGRDPKALGMLGRIPLSAGVEASLRAVDLWRKADATHIALNTMGAGFRSIDEHIDALETMADKLQLARN
jgi:probable F420-dependent oxidoreductase